MNFCQKTIKIAQRLFGTEEYSFKDDTLVTFGSLEEFNCLSHPPHYLVHLKNLTYFHYIVLFWKSYLHASF